jgi:hypothetical protein
VSNPYQKELDWFSLYQGDTSRDDLLFKKASVAHPAKGSLPLFNRILDTMIEFGWLKNGACVVDPFGGRGTTALLWTCRHPENRAVTVEIEPHFVQMQHENKAHAEKRLGRALRWEIIQGDSRVVDSLLAEAGCAAVSSPPYGKIDFQPIKNAENKTGGIGAAYREGRIKAVGSEVYGSHPAQIGNLPDRDGTPGEAPAPACVLGSPPYEASLASDDPEKRGGFLKSDPKRRNDRTMNAGYTPPAAISSPPYETSINDRNGVDVSKCAKAGKTSQAHSKGYQTPPAAALGSPPFESQSGGHPLPTSGPLADPALHARHAASKINAQAGYGPQTALGSPPFEDSVATADPNFLTPGEQGKRVPSKSNLASYGENGAGQIGAQQGENYASACLQVYQALARAGVRFVCLVTKNPTRRLTGVRWCACFHEREWSLRRLNRLAGKLHRYPLPVALWLVTIFAAWVETLDAAGWPETDTARHQTVILGGNRYPCCGGCGKPIPRAGGELRRLDKLTARLLRQAGYRVVAWRRAVLFESEGDQHERHGQGCMFGDEVAPSSKKVGRLSFFRRLHISKGGVAAAAEDVFFAELVTAGGEGCAVSSPPYGEALSGGEFTLDPTMTRRKQSPAACAVKTRAYGPDCHGRTPGNIGNLRDTDAPVCISSPPYADVEVMTPKGAIGAAWQQGKHARDTFAQEDKGARRYGRTEGQIGALKDTDQPAVVIASPPYGGHSAPGRKQSAERDVGLAPTDRIGASCRGEGYGNTPGQIEELPDTPTEPDR